MIWKSRYRFSEKTMLIKRLDRRFDRSCSLIDFGSISAKVSQDTAFHRKKFPKLVIFRTF